MKTPILTTIVEEMKEAQVKSVAQKSEIDKVAEDYAMSVLRFVRRKEVYMDCCGGMYYA